MPYADRMCDHCQRIFTPDYPNQRRCSEECKQEARDSYLKDWYEKKKDSAWEID